MGDRVWLKGFQRQQTHGSKSDAYAVFVMMRDTGNPPEDWEALMQAVKAIPDK